MNLRKMLEEIKEQCEEICYDFMKFITVNLIKIDLKVWLD